MNLIVLFFTLGVVLADTNNNGYKSYKNYKVFNVTGNDLEALSDFRKHIQTNYSVESESDVVFVSGSGRALQVLLPEGLLQHFHAALQQRNLTAKLLHDDFSQCIELEKSGRTNEFGWSAYYDVDEINDYLRNMSARYPEWAAPVVGGRSYEGRDILGLRVRTSSATDRNKPAIFIESGIHAREWLAPATTTYFINQLLTSNDPNITALRDTYDWHIFPTVNPDGYQFSRKKDRMWRKTRSKSPNSACFGADPNRNWDYNWNTVGTSSDPCGYEIYAGSKPFSEVETRSLAEYIQNVKNLQAYLAFHSDVQMMLVPYSDSKEHRDNYDDLVKIGRTAIEYGYRVNGERYKGPDTAPVLLRYAVSGGSMDWVQHTLRTPLVFTWELRGNDRFHWPPERIPEQGDEVTQMILGLISEAVKMGYLK